jgi:hypothetical protein
VEIAAGILIFFAAQWFAAALGFVFNMPITPLPLVIGLVTSVTFVAWANRSMRARVVNVIILIGSILLSMLLTLPVPDISWDGLGYHQDAILSLAKGWNPFRLLAPTDVPYPEWLSYFSKGAWYSGASIYTLTQNMNISKYGAVLLMLPPALVFYTALQDAVPNRTRRIFWTLVYTLNPVALYQLFTKYIDGQLGALVSVTVALLLIRSERRDRTWYAVLGAVVILLINIKLTGAIFAAILIGGFLWLDVLRRRFDQKAWGTVIVAGLIAVFIGWNPYITQYVTNTITHRAPFYPTTEHELTHMNDNLPVGFQNRDRFEKFFVSLFSRTDADQRQTPRYKLPFTFDEYEIRQMIYWDVRIAGFGPLFSGIVLLMLAALLLTGRGMRWEAGVLIGLLLVGSVINPEMWWARYVPGLWLIPILIVLFNRADGARRVWSARLIGATMAANILMTLIPVIIRTSEIIRDSLNATQ